MLYFILIIEKIVILLFALLFPPMYESCLLSHASYSVERIIIEYCFHIDFCTWLLRTCIQTSTCTCTQECAIVVVCHHIMNMHDGS